MTHVPQSIDEIVAAQAYIHAKLRKFELDQVTQPFAHTASRQGLGRAVRGALQRGALKAAGKIIRFAPAPGTDTPCGPYERYVERVAGEIESERAQVATFEATHGDSFARDLYHKIRDAPESSVPTYKASRVVFRKLTRDLERARAQQSANPLEKAWRNATAWITYGDRELKAIAIGTGLALGAGIMVPVHRINEWNDHHRPIAHVKYDHKTDHPIIAAPIAGRNLEMYLHETFNQASRVEGARSSFAQEYNDFIDCITCDEKDPGAEPQAYNLRFTHNDAGNDWTRPWSFLLRNGVFRARELLKPSNAPVDTIANGRNAVDSSWGYEKTAEDGHMEEITTCSTDEKGNQTCTTIYYYVCDWKSWRFTLDKDRLISGVQDVQKGSDAFPLSALPRADPRSRLETLGGLDKRGKPEELLKELEFRNAWARSDLISNYNTMLVTAGQLSDGPLLPKIQSEMRGYEPIFDDPHSSCSGPQRFPHGWSDHNALVAAADAVVNPHRAIHSTLNTYDTFVPEIRKRIAIIEKDIDGANAAAAVRDLGNLAWKMSNTSGFDGWHPTHGTRIFLEWLGFMGIAGATFGGAFGLFNKYRHTRTVRKLYENGVAPETVDPWRSG